MLSKHAKLSGEKTFLFDRYYIKVWTYETRYSWGHYAELYDNGYLIDDIKYTYYNRTWESYTYQSIVHGILEKNKLPDLKVIADEIGEGHSRHEIRALGGIVAMAGLLQPDNENDAKMKALETVSNGQVQRPEDWDQLPEEEKAKRLAGALEYLK